MIFRRFLQRFRQQQWGAIATELAIVVIGVFIGIQVSNWNEDRATARRADVFTERLRSDLREEAWGYEMQVGYYGDVAAYGRRALDAMAGRGSLSDDALLIAAYRATQYNGNIRRRATYDELTSRGEIGLVTDASLRDLAQRVYSAPLFDYIVEEGRTSQYRQWFRLNMPHDVQRALATTCGDRNIVVGDYAGIDDSIDYPCSSGLSANVIKAAVAILREDPEAVRLLRVRVADVDTSLSNLTLYQAQMRDGLRAIAKAAP